MKTFIITTLALAVSLFSYTFGYHQGGNDVATMEHVLKGKASLILCKDSASTACKRFHSSSVRLAVSSRVKYGEQLSPLAPYINPFYEIFNDNTSSIKDEITKNGYSVICGDLSALNNEELFTSCNANVDEFMNL
ncbi:hypothetical protein RGQ13_15090 [Thalassotalea psychrophila]|uniref:Uncharacterized protein n=1 Tax=Thalassotalea psychrophila TaxID=3065647 RepID=A0ABY9TRI3_9GAMM|nr:hypothetical protein RGQ13_15090 [Colwelliaceae bacterium SQ149]